MKQYKTLVFCLTAVISATMFSCSKDSGSTTPSVSIADTSQTVNENVGTVSVTVKLSKAATQNVQLSFELSGDAVLNGDYSVDSASTITIPAGSTSATLTFTIFDDPVPEDTKTINVKFSSSADVSLANAQAAIIIEDNDVSEASNGLQTDLFWDAGDLVNLDLYVANNVVISGGSVTDFDLVVNSENANGFESTLINNSDADGEYYIVLYYNSGSRTVNYTLRFNSPNIVDETIDDSLSASDVGYAYFFGPITKSGSTYNRQMGSNFNLSKMKAYVYHGQLSK